MSDWPQHIYAAEGPVWRDAEGEEHCGWPHDGWSVELTREGPDTYRILEERRHIDGDGLRSDERRVDADGAARWLAGRARKEPRAFTSLCSSFEAQLGAALVLVAGELEGRRVTLRRLGGLVLREREGSFMQLDDAAARALVARLGGDSSVLDG